MNTVGKIIEHVSGQLNDQGFKLEYTRWNRETQLEYMNQALKEIGTYRPDAFTRTEPITLVAGTKQTVGDFKTLKGIHDSNGLPIHEGDASLLKAFMAYDYCTPKVQYKNGTPVYNVKSFGVSAADSKVFYVSPPVPNGVTPTITATLIGEPPELTLVDWDTELAMEGKYYNNLIDFMQARAYELDSESPNSRANSQMYFTRFYQAMGVKYRIDAAVKSGYYKGEVGTGDPRAVIR
ncbi:MAG: DUF6682 family protein [Bacteroidota bacterium]